MNFSPVATKLSYANTLNQGFKAFNGLNDPGYEKYEDKFKNPNPKAYKNHVMMNKGLYQSGDDNDHGISRLFFSSENIKRIQKMIKREIYNRTKGEFVLDEDQDEADLMVVMEDVKKAHCRYLNFQIVRQVKDLNRKTVEHVVPDMITAMKQHYGYIKEINSPIKPLSNPICMNRKGTKSLPAMSTLYF
jgi:hypothetical protein